MTKIVLEFIPAEQARLGEPGDWYFDNDGNLICRCVDLGSWVHNFLLARHEMDEAMLCRAAGITAADIDADQVYAQEHPELECNPDSFSGYPGSPHQRQHNHALAAEWVMAQLLEVDWPEYGEAYEAACKKIKEAQNGSNGQTSGA